MGDCLLGAVTWQNRIRLHFCSTVTFSH
jgi:hypothetical protein